MFRSVSGNSVEQFEFLLSHSCEIIRFWRDSMWYNVIFLGISSVGEESHPRNPCPPPPPPQYQSRSDPGE